jgi:hypothetical protein
LQVKYPKIALILFAFVLLTAGAVAIYFWVDIKAGKNESDFLNQRKTIETFIKENIETIVPDNPKFGGSWFVTELMFLTPDMVRVNYEDGHKAGVLVLEIKHVQGNRVIYRILR